MTALRSEGRGRRADAVAARLSGIDTVGVPPTALAAAPAALTRREREVAELAADRLTAAQIAERLGLSPRTVENHLQRVYAKLGVAGRAELQSLLRGRSPGHGG